MNPVKGKKYREPRAGIRHLFPIVVILIAPLVVCFLHVAGIDEIYPRMPGNTWDYRYYWQFRPYSGHK